MKTLTMLVCPVCGSRDTTGHGRYETVHNGTRSLHACTNCGEVFSETTGTPMQGIKTPISKVAAALRLRGEGLGLRATARILGTHKNTLAAWERRFAGMKPTLMLYGLCHVFIPLTFEGDEIDTVVGQRVHPSDSTGWKAIILERVRISLMPAIHFTGRRPASSVEGGGAFQAGGFSVGAQRRSEQVFTVP